MIHSTKATEAQVLWAHHSSVIDIYLSRAMNAEMMDLVRTMKSWDLDRIQELLEKGDPEFERAVFLVGSELSHWNARYFTQTSEEDRAILEKHIRLNANAPIYGSHFDRSGRGFFRTEFDEFLARIIKSAS